MSLESELNEYRRKRKKKEENTELRKNNYPGANLLYNSADIAPVGGYSNIAPIRESEKEEKTEESDDRTWFKAGAFEDGYQFGDVLRTVGASATDLSANVVGGILDIGEGVVDAGASLVAGVGGIFSDDFQEDVEGFIEKDLYEGREIAKYIVGGLNPSTLFPDSEYADFFPDPDEDSIFGERSRGALASLGQYAAQLGLTAVTGGAIPWWVIPGVTGYGGEVENALNQDATLGEAAVSGLITGGAEALFEKLSGGIKFGGKALDDALTKQLATKISNKFVRNGLKTVRDMAGEGAEEWLSEDISRFGQWLTYQDDKTLAELLYSEEAMDAKIEAFIGGAFVGGVVDGGRAVKSTVTGRDATSGLTANEEKVFNHEYEKRLAEEAEAKGEKLTSKEKNKIYDETMEDLQKGRIDTDTIESVLGGESYKTYKDTVDSENSLREQKEKLQAEFDALQKMKQGDMTGEQMDRRTELREQLAQLDAEIKQSENDYRLDAWKEKLSTNVQGMLTRQVGKRTQSDNYLLESYAERGRRSEAFKADTTKYKGAQAEVVQKAIESGVLNNTRRTHEFVDLISKISADKGVLFDFTNNQKLKESGFAVEGASVNGFVSKDGITLNMDSHKAWQSTVGHEITHVLEGTELYTELQNAIKAYAESKGEYQSRYDATKELYKKIKDADIDAELTADLVGEYLFTDEAFVQNLSAKNRNVFQKIYDELKYLLKVATAGSKEARELEKVKRAFDKAYKAGGNASEGTKYSISDKNIKDVSTGFAPGESYYTMTYTQDGKVVGTLEYGEYDGEPNVKMIEVEPEYRRKGIATKLMQELQKKYPDAEIDFGMSTPDGTKLLDAITYDVTDEAVVAEKQKLKTLQTELDGLQGKLDALFELIDNGKELTEAQDTELHELGDRWQEVYETIRDLEKSVRGKRATKTYVKTDTKYSLSDNAEGKKYLDKYTQKQYNSFGWARDAEAVTQNELDDMYSKIHEKGSLKKFPQTSHGEAIIEVNDNPHTTLGTDNVFIFVTGSNNNPQINKVVRFQVETDTEMEIIKEKLYERGSFSDTYYSYIREEGFAREYSKKSSLDYNEYAQKVRRGSGRADSNRADRNSGVKRNRRWTFEETESNDIAPVKASSTDGVFFDGNKPKYSLSDSDGKALTKEQGEYFKDSKMRDENGNLKVMYHGSQDAGFHVFDPSMSDDGTSLFFVDRNDVAASYSGTTETYEAQSIRTAEDMNRFIESIGAEGYEVVENDGKFTLLYEGDRVADSNTAKGIYEEFCWYEGVGEGDANYKVYLNLTNPLEIDAKGRPWNKIDAEFSQEVYDKFKSLTAEEKAALVDLAEWEDFRLFNSEIQEARDNELASAYAKLGEDSNIYDIFSVAADNFSEESLRENSRKYLKTRDYAERAKEQGYDGVIFKNIHDNGGYSNGDEGASTVAIAFDSNQVKSVANGKPTKNADIRYSLTEYTAEEKKAHNDAVLKHFGKTYKWAETGYLLLDGSKLDLSGKHDGAPGGYRTVDHRDITDALGYDYGGDGYSDSLVQFMSEGNIRIVPEINGINLSVKPTKAQEQALSDYISRYRGEVVLDIDDLNGNTVVSVEYPKGTYYAKVLNDIREWFDNGKKPEMSEFSPFRSLTKEGEKPRNRGYATPLSDLRLQEDIAPVADAAPVEDIAPEESVTETPIITGDYAPQADPTLYDLENEIAELERAAQEAYAAEDTAALDEIAPRYNEVVEKIRQMEKDDAEMQSELLNSLDDADAPPETEAPYYGEESPIDPFADRDVKDVRHHKAYMYENPEVKPFFQAEANVLLGEWQRAEKPQTIYNGDLKYDMNYDAAKDIPDLYRVSRNVSEGMETLLDTYKMSYADIKKGLDAIIEDNGAENIAAAKKIEFLINDRLLNGYNAEGVPVPANVDYKNLVKEKAIFEYSEEARAKLFENGDDIAPMAESPKKASKSAESVEGDIAPTATYETTKKSQIHGQRTMFAEEKIAEVLTEETEGKRKNRKVLSMFKNSFLDKGMVFEDLSLETGNRELQAKYNSMRYAEGMAQTLMKDGDADANVESLKAIKSLVESTGKTKEFSEYLYHLHNVDRMSLEEKAGIRRQELAKKFWRLKPEQVKAIAATKITEKTTARTAQTIKEAREYLNAAEVKNKPVFGDSVTADVSRETAARLEQENPSFKGMAEKVYGYMNYLRATLVEGGVISQETADLWAETYPHYVPIRRAGKDGAAINVPLDTGRTGINAPIKKATGGNSDILPLFDTMAMRTEQTFKAVTRNRFGVELKNTLGVETANEQLTIDDAIESIDMQDGLLQEGKNGEKPTFTVFENGERVTFSITEEMYDALKPASGLSTVTIKPVRFLSETFRGLLTEYNLVFAATNAAKDVQDVLFNSQHATATYKAIPRAIKEMSKKGKYYQEYLKNGGAQNTYFDGDTKTFKEEDSGLKKLIGMPFRSISALNNTIERVPRLAEYIASREAGRSIDVAMLDAARVTTNFAAGGDVTKAMNRNGFTFLNASVQGAMQQVRNLREAKAAGFKGAALLATKVALAGLPAILLNSLLWDDDEDYEELSDYVKDNYYVVAKYGDGQFVRIPKGRMVAVVQDAFEQMGNAMTGNDEVDLNNFLDLLWTNVAPNNPIDNNILAPILQVKNNETWYGEDLVPQRLADLPAAEQYDESTDSISKWLGEKLNYSPYKINYLLNQYTGGIGDIALPMLTPEAERGDDSALGNVIAPWKDKFTTDSVMNNQNVSDFYTTMDELTANAKSIHATDEDVLSYKYFNTVNSELSELYKKKREIQNGSLSDSEKYDAVREIQEQINSIARTSLDTYGNVMIDGEYAHVGNVHYHKNDKGEWVKVTDDQLDKQGEVTSGLGIAPSEYWSNKSEYDFAYEYPEKYAVAKSIGGYEAYKTYSSELYDIKADKDASGKSITGSRKEKVIDYVNNLDIDYGARLIIFKSEYNADDTYNYDIIDYLNSREDISYEDMVSILKELGFTVDSKGNIYW